MGCDINMYAEVRICGEWQAVGKVFEDDDYRDEDPSCIEACDKTNTRTYESNPRYSMHPYDGRNYALFAFLADVRNHWGIDPIAPERGIPGDASQFVKNEVEAWNSNGHSHSWLTLDELRAAPWERSFTEHGVLNPGQYREFKDNGRPSSWCGGAGGRGVVMVSNDEMDGGLTWDLVRITDQKIADGRSYYTSVNWQTTMAQAAGDFVTSTIPALQALLDKEGVEDVRVVFFFDN